MGSRTTMWAAAALTGALLAAGQAGAQSPYPPDRYDRGYGTDRGWPGARDRHGDPYGAVYDEARVVRVDPVVARGGYGNACYTRDDGAVYRDGYGAQRGYDPYDPYARDRYDPRPGSEGGRTVATIVGGVVGAVLGSRVGGGSARYATSAVGSMAGGIAGREIYDAVQRDRYGERARVTVCEPVDAGYGYGDGYGSVPEYEVTYEYAGRLHTARMPYHPGSTVRIRVDTRPE
ncbi:glycine zipper 2TM domain-containing protein [Luteimonas sp. Y-2-2-4F]|nr:glycine zipper 2TM domain-containing protein [Luteimonas sp. Y-2-2-4F]MCD9032298.1 glycine zipper 2TM domain-containing protein [Luteimonas sp. Y-2-2-4F]